MTPAAFAVFNLDAVAHNLSKVQSRAPNAKIMAVIKANAYGHGLLRIAQALRHVDAFAVARVDEGIRLRKAGFKNKIAVLEGFTCRDELDQLLHHQLEPVVHCLTQVEILETTPPQPACAIWLKIDTGMGRLGFKAKDFKQIHQRLAQCAIIQQPISLMTHFSSADEPDNPKTEQQINLFKTTVAGYSGECSLANSAAILAWEQSVSDWVRPGVMLYGLSPFADSTGRQLGLKPVMELHSRLIAVKQLEAGDSVGYGGDWICQKPTTLGVVAIGYGDGYPRQAKSGAPVLVNNQRVPLIGRVSMDMITVDLKSQPHAKPGDPVTLWGEALPVEEIAQWADTIPYTLVCGVTRRVQIIEKLPEK